MENSTAFSFTSHSRDSIKAFEAFLESLLTGKLSDDEVLGILKSLNALFGEPLSPPVEYLTTAAQIMLKHSVKVRRISGLNDTCGTGGDSKNLFNISSLTALVSAACGLKTAKHGNRAVSGSFGSADFYSRLGISIEEDPKTAADALEKNGFVFLFAPSFHPAMKYAGPARKALGKKSIFNCLGPLTNPFRPDSQIIGLFSLTIAEPMLRASKELGVTNITMVHSDDGSDEVASWTSTHLLSSNIHTGHTVRKHVLNPKQFSRSTVRLSELVCSEPDDNMRMADLVIEGKDSPQLHTVALNSAVALWNSGNCNSITDGYDKAMDAAKSGSVKDLVSRIVL